MPIIFHFIGGPSGGIKAKTTVSLAKSLRVWTFEVRQASKNASKTPYSRLRSQRFRPVASLNLWGVTAKPLANTYY